MKRNEHVAIEDLRTVLHYLRDAALMLLHRATQTLLTFNMNTAFLTSNHSLLVSTERQDPRLASVVSNPSHRANVLWNRRITLALRQI